MLWILPDHLGSTRDLVDTLGKVVAHYQYDSFGVLLDGRENVTRYQFAGREHDSNTDLNYHRARWYDPATGKWMSEDPIGFEAGNANVTRYVSNGVLIATDPSGLEKHWHHILPQEFRERFEKMGFDIDVPPFGWIMSKKMHKELHDAGYNDTWRAFLKTLSPRGNQRRHQTAVIREIATIFGQYDEFLGKGRTANMTYKQWLSGIKNLKIAMMAAKNRPGSKQIARVFKLVGVIGKASKVLAVVSFIYCAATEDFASAAEGAAEDLVWPVGDMIATAADEAGRGYLAMIESGMLRRKIDASNINGFISNPNGEIPRIGPRLS